MVLPCRDRRNALCTDLISYPMLVCTAAATAGTSCLLQHFFPYPDAIGNQPQHEFEQSPAGLSSCAVITTTSNVERLPPPRMAAANVCCCPDALLLFYPYRCGSGLDFRCLPWCASCFSSRWWPSTAVKHCKFAGNMSIPLFGASGHGWVLVPGLERCLRVGRSLHKPGLTRNGVLFSNHAHALSRTHFH